MSILDCGGEREVVDGWLFCVSEKLLRMCRVCVRNISLLYNGIFRFFYNFGDFAQET